MDPHDRSSGVKIAVLSFFFVLCLASPSAGLDIPPGSWSCRECTDDGSTVRCQCKTKKGSWNNTGLAYRICEPNKIWNDNGTLKCTPQGSFKRSCSSVSWNESFLTAKCNKKKQGTTWNSGFNYGQCVNNGQDITNCDGSLRCGGCN